MKWLVTGCHGFLGSSFSAFAAASGHEILGVARSSQPPSRWSGPYLSADVAVSDLAGIVRDFCPDAVVHGAGSASVAASFHSPHDDFRASMAAWSNVLDSIRRSGTDPVIFFPSSAAVYGQPQSLPVGEKATANPLSPYGYHKYGGEILAESYSKFFGLKIVLLRLFSIFGPRQRKLLLWEIYRQIQSATTHIELLGTGDETRDFLHIDDLALAIVQLAELPMEKKVPLLLNIGRGEEQTVRSVAETMLKLSASGLSLKCRGEARTGNPERWGADAAKLRNLLPQWQPKPFLQSLRETISLWDKEFASS